VDLELEGLRRQEFWHEGEIGFPDRPESRRSGSERQSAAAPPAVQALGEALATLTKKPIGWGTRRAIPHRCGRAGKVPIRRELSGRSARGGLHAKLHVSLWRPYSRTPTLVRQPRRWGHVMDDFEHHTQFRRFDLAQSRPAPSRVPMALLIKSPANSFKRPTDP
jgi:hypothetical protein